MKIEDLRKHIFFDDNMSGDTVNVLNMDKVIREYCRREGLQQGHEVFDLKYVARFKVKE